MANKADWPTFFRKIGEALKKEGFSEISLEKTVGEADAIRENGKYLSIYSPDPFGMPYSFCAELKNKNGSVIAKIKCLSESYNVAAA